MNLMTADEIAELQREFDQFINDQMLLWVLDGMYCIEEQIKQKNTGTERIFEGKVQIPPFEFCLSKELSLKINSSRKNFHKGGEISEELLKKCFTDDWFKDVGRFELYNTYQLSVEKLKIKSESKERIPLKYLACFGVSLEENIMEEQKGILFKRVVKKKRNEWKFKGISLLFLKKFEKECKEKGIQLLGAEIVFYNKNISSITPRVHTMDSLFDSCVCKETVNTYDMATFLKWKYENK